MSEFDLKRIYDDAKDDFQINYMRKKAIHNIDSLYNYICDNENEILVEIPFDLSYEGFKEDLEYLWFSLIEIEDGEIVCQSIQCPLYVFGIQGGEIYRFELQDISNWIIKRCGEIIFPS
ncbi:MAG: hypothetical protein RR738_06905 [Anaerorhabdus sp.]|uniref:hypothetical protein n=1 Tax=Anaerorhabdus sp. TaxID=1872524 RepID=UPI002B20617F|nr:hypothetical protein [Anaerorhabdus sp.]MEA4875544.1 hypothetical protein [Anaerorhabdus sp.]